MSKILKNQTASIVTVDDIGIQVPASGQTTIQTTDYLLAAGSSDLVTLIGNGTLVVNDGSTDLSITDGVDLIKGLFPKEIETFANEMKYDQQGRFRVSTQHSLFELGGGEPFDTTRYWSVTTAGSGTTEAAANSEPARLLKVTTASGDKAQIQSFRRVEYNKGHSQLVLMTGAFNAAKANLRQRIGYYCDLHGLFFEHDGTDLKVVRRESVSTGSAVDHAVTQSNWNVDPLDGTGPSGLTLSLNKATVFGFDFLWLGVKSIRFFVVIGETPILVHKMNVSNTLTHVYMDSAMAPFRCEIENTGTTASASQIKFICSSVKSEGEQQDVGTVRVVDTGASAVSVSNTPSIVAGIRIKTPNFINSSIKPLTFKIQPQSGNDSLYYQVIFNPTLTGATWADNSEGIAQLLTNNPTFSGGSVIDSGFLPLGNKNADTATLDATVLSDVYLGADCEGNNTALILVAQTVSGNGSILFSGKFREYR